MALSILCSSFPQKILLAPACLLACVWLQAPPALAQHGGHAGGGHFGGGGHFTGTGHVSAPHISAPRAHHATMIRPQGVVRQRPIFIRRRIFLHAPFFRFREGFFNSWWPNCGPLWSWDWEYACNEFPLYGAGFDNYVTAPVYENAPYMYGGGGGERDVVQLFLKQGTAWNVTDYWFVGDQVHFITVEDGGAKSVERTIALSELDLQRTIDVNTQRGFRFVKRDEPLEQYLRDHPDANPPLVEPPKKN